MELSINKFRIELNNLVASYQDKGIPAYIMSGLLSQELLRVKERELAEFTVTVNNDLLKKEGTSNGQSVSEQS